MKKHYPAFQSDIPSKYNPKKVEDKWYKFWEENNLFTARPDPAKKPYTIVIPPPNITGILHMGHALNNTIQDILIRWHRMMEEPTLWVPGTDHAGIATQNVVERELAKEGFNRKDLGREEFLKRVWEWQEQYGNTIINQLKRLGASCDWRYLRFTMDEGYSEAVREAFVVLGNKKLIDRDYKIINWCPRCQTALSDEEAPHRELQGNLYYLRYPFATVIASPRGAKQSDAQLNFITVATTRPETMLGDTAVAINPDDKRYKKFIGKTLILPLVGREIKIIADSMVDMKFGTGAVKVTPAHDSNDYILGKKHNLKFINIMNYDGTLNYEAGKYETMDRFEAREEILKDLRKINLLEDIQLHKHTVSHCYRCNTVIEPYLSWQWFVRMESLAKPAIDVVKEGKIKFYPKRWTKVYLNWMENIKDWCISRQIWWGHRIPVYYCKRCSETEKSEILNPKSETNSKFQIQNSKQKKGVLVSKTRPEKCPTCNSTDIYQDEDVLDTWFSSWLWPFATLGWPRETKDIKYFYPTSTLVTAPEIIFFWVARMIMAGLEFMNELPFKDVYIHGTVRDITGKKMSKSLGNIIDPIDIINEYGADALRYSLVSITAVGQDIFLSKDKFEFGRNFANKLWNASRFVLMNLKKEYTELDLCVFFKEQKINLPQRWILSRLYTTLDSLNKALQGYNFNEAANCLYQFFWHEFCDWYVEIAKRELGKKETHTILYKVLEKSIRMLHPFMPFITEELWQRLNEGSSIMVQPWPHLQKQMIDKRVEYEMQLIIGIVTAIRNIHAEFEIPQDKRPDVVISLHSPKIELFINENISYIKTLSRTSDITTGRDLKRPAQSASAFLKEAHLFIPLKGMIDIEKEREILSRRIKDIEMNLNATSARLKNKSFTINAPKEVVDKEREKKKSLSERLSVLKKNLMMLK